MGQTKEFQAYRRKLLDSSPMSVLLQIRDDLTSEDTSSEDTLAGIVCRIDAYAKQFHSKANCPRCGGQLYLSDLPQYRHVCYACDENF